MVQPPDDSPVPLSIHHAFIVHVRADTSVQTGQIAGRIEHIVSGQAAHFASLQALLDFIARVLDPGQDVSS
ncbi:MAG: hypothetical protein OEU26_15410 [Candidatus Tectomicrobia bacterium]|nr:hypothetical protein [Candidatus Tectomicrobia bacterium]